MERSDNTPLNKFFDKDFYTVGVQAKWNLFDGKIKDNNLQKAKIENLKVQEPGKFSQTAGDISKS